MKYSLPLVVLLFLVAAQGFSAVNDDDLLLPTDRSEPGYGGVPFDRSSSPPSTFTAAQPQPLQSTATIGSSQGPAQVRPSMRSQIDPDHPFAQLQFDTIVPGSRITGRPLTVCEMLESVSSPQARCQLLHAYWSLAGELAKYKIVLRKQNQFAKWGQDGTNSTKAAAFQAAERQAAAQRQSLELHVILKQTELAALLRQMSYYRPIVQANQPDAEQLPIPCDLPFIGVYQTHVNQLVQFRSSFPPSNLVLLDKTIDLRRQIFEAKCEEFNATAELFDAVRGSETSIAALMQANNQYYATYAECIDAIVAYNETIAEYVALTVGPEITGRRLLMTLIQLNPEASSTSNSSFPGPTEDPADVAPVLGQEFGY